ncbi:MAG: hypothetical protein GKR95_08430 [Gammaproteobacteria bacterium]|nr:hypothetical protein [Gammaproteobacteria bacterium]
MIIQFIEQSFNNRNLEPDSAMSKKLRIVYPDADVGDDQHYKAIFSRLEAHCEFEIYTGRPEAEEEYIQRIKHADGVLLGWDMPKKVMAAAANLRVISFTGVGVEKFIDLKQANDQNIVVCNCPGYSDNTVAEHTMGLLLALARRLPVLDISTKNGEWTQPFDQIGFEGMELRGKTIGIIGFGGIGKRFSQLCHAFGMEVLVWTRRLPTENQLDFNVKFVELEQLYNNSDIISLHLAANPETSNFIDQSAFEMMKSGVLLLNTARGELINENALVAALKCGRVKGAAMDVFVNEPVTKYDPLTKLANVVLTPHIGYRTPESIDTLFGIGVDNLVSFFAGEPTNVVSLS